jgi:hypothetical protein
VARPARTSFSPVTLNDSPRKKIADGAMRPSSIEPEFAG